MALSNVFQDPVLAQRQQALNSQWKAMNNLQQGCDGIPTSAWVEFVNDYRSWQEFFDSGSDWSSSSKKATDEWQIKLQEWTKRFGQYGCVGSIGSVNGEDILVTTPDQGIPGVKDPPPDQPGVFDTILDRGKDIVDTTKTVAWVGVGLVVLILVGLIYLLRGGASGYGVKIGG